MNENIKKFLAKVEQDQELQNKMSQIRDPEEAYKLASSVQEGFTKEEFITEMKKLYEEGIKELSDEDMVKVAGGLSEATQNVVATVASVSATFATSLAAAAGAT